jgi:hypothetical protein
MADIGDELYNVASSAAYYQVYVAMCFTFLKIVFLYISILLLRPLTSKQRLVYQ